MGGQACVFYGAAQFSKDGASQEDPTAKGLAFRFNRKFQMLTRTMAMKFDRYTFQPSPCTCAFNKTTLNPMTAS